MKKGRPGRNDPCPCGSGKKYKKCHLGIENQAPVEPWELAKGMKKAFQKGGCLASQSVFGPCQGGVVKAHSVSRSAHLGKIARKGHVYTMDYDPFNFFDEGDVSFKLSGTSDASVFSGFCKKHDNDIFEPIDSEFGYSDLECALYAYRAICRELYFKECMSDFLDFENPPDRGMPIERRIEIQTLFSGARTGALLGVDDARARKGELERMLDSNDFAGLSSLVVELDSPPSIMCAFGTSPHHDYDGNDLRLPGHFNGDVLFVSSMASVRGGVVVLTWLNSSDSAAEGLVRSLEKLDDKSLGAEMPLFLFGSGENLCVAPDWWESLSAAEKATLIDVLSEKGNPTLSYNPHYLRPPKLPPSDYVVRNRLYLNMSAA